MKQVIYTVESNERIARDIYRMTLRGDNSAISAPGQFINIKLGGLYLRRPISVCDIKGEILTIIYKAVGKARDKLPDTWRVYVLSSHPDFERCYGRFADKKRKLYNGMLKCDLFMYGKRL